MCIPILARVDNSIRYINDLYMFSIKRKTCLWHYEELLASYYMKELSTLEANY